MPKTLTELNAAEHAEREQARLYELALNERDLAERDLARLKSSSVVIDLKPLQVIRKELADRLSPKITMQLNYYGDVSIATFLLPLVEQSLAMQVEREKDRQRKVTAAESRLERARKHLETFEE